MKATIEKIVYPGKSLIRSTGKTIFTDCGLPDETVEIEILEEKKNYIQAKTVNVVDPSPYRVQPECSHYMDCSSYQYIKYEKQLEIKKEQLEEIFSDTIKSPLPEIVAAASPETLEYRNKIRLKLVKTSGGHRFAYTKAGTHNKHTLIDECHLVSEKMNNTLFLILETIKTANIDCITEVELKESYANKNILVIIYCRKKAKIEKIARDIIKLSKAPEIAGIVIVKKKKNIFEETLIYGKPFIEETLMGKRFLIGAQTFFQVNIPVMKRVIDDVKEYTSQHRPDTIADLYCGTGLFGILLNEYAQRTAFIESEPDNIAFLKANLKNNGIKNFFLLEGTCQQCFPQIVLEKIDMLILDPPRKGVDKITLNYIITCKPQHIVYLSCNPATLARDISVLSDSYQVKKIGMYDFFAHTPHIETLVILEKL